jgi:hypothetical protein
VIVDVLSGLELAYPKSSLSAKELLAIRKELAK